MELLRSAKKTYFEELTEKLNSNKFGSKDWWKLVKKLSGRSPSQTITTLVTDNGEVIQDDIEKANLINSFFLRCSQQLTIQAKHYLPFKITQTLL